MIRTHLSGGQLKNDNEYACCDLDQSIKRFWEIETFGTETCETRIYTDEENAALTQVKESLSYDDTTHRYTVGVPWKADRPKLPDNRESAKSRLRWTEKS